MPVPKSTLPPTSSSSSLSSPSSLPKFGSPLSSHTSLAGSPNRSPGSLALEIPQPHHNNPHNSQPQQQQQQSAIWRFCRVLIFEFTFNDEPSPEPSPPITIDGISAGASPGAKEAVTSTVGDSFSSNGTHPQPHFTSNLTPIASSSSSSSSSPSGKKGLGSILGSVIGSGLGSGQAVGLSETSNTTTTNTTPSSTQGQGLGQGLGTTSKTTRIIKRYDSKGNVKEVEEIIDDDRNSNTIDTGGRGIEKGCYWNVKFISQIVPPITLGELHTKYDAAMTPLSGNALYVPTTPGSGLGTPRGSRPPSPARLRGPSPGVFICMQSIAWHCANTPSQHILSTHPLNTRSEDTTSIYPLNLPS